MNFFIITIDDVTVFDFRSKTIVPLADISASCLLPDEEVANLVLQESLIPLLTNADSEKVRIFGSINPNILIDGVSVSFENGRVSSIEYTDLVETSKEVVLFTDIKVGLPLSDILKSVDSTKIASYYLHIVHTVDGEDLITVIEKGIDVYDIDVIEPFKLAMMSLATGDVDSLKSSVGRTIRRLKNPSFRNYSFQVADKFNVKLQVKGKMIENDKYSLPKDIDVTDKNTWYYIEYGAKVNYSNGIGIVTLDGVKIDEFILRDSLTYRSFVNECENYLHSPRFTDLTGIELEHDEEVPVKPLPDDSPYDDPYAVDPPVVEEPPVELVVEEPPAEEELPPKDPIVEEPPVEEPIAEEPLPPKEPLPDE